MNPNQYRLLDCGDKEKVEMFGPWKLIRPCPQALWKKTKPNLWEKPDSVFIRTGEEKGYWQKHSNVPDKWLVESSNGLKWEVEPNQFGNIGVFTEHWLYAEDLLKLFDPKSKVLNLFTYSGSNCVILAKNGIQITAVDSSKQAMTTYNTNLENNGISKDGQRFILEDAFKFIAREVRREAKYDGLMIDAPSYGRGTKGEVFKIEDHLVDMLHTCRELMHDQSKLILTLHSPRFTPEILRILCSQIFSNKTVETGEIVQTCESGIYLPSGFLVKVF